MNKTHLFFLIVTIIVLFLFVIKLKNIQKIEIFDNESKEKTPIFHYISHKDRGFDL